MHLFLCYFVVVVVVVVVALMKNQRLIEETIKLNITSYVCKPSCVCLTNFRILLTAPSPVVVANAGFSYAIKATAYGAVANVGSQR